MTQFLCAFISFYQRAISPFTGCACRYIPSCSEYTLDAIRASGPWSGVMKGMLRLVRCAPWGGSGLDPYEK